MLAVINLFCGSQVGQAVEFLSFFFFPFDLILKLNIAPPSPNLEAELKEKISEHLHVSTSTIIFNCTHFPTFLASGFVHVVKF